MLAEVLATIASIGDWLIHNLLRLRYMAWFLTSYFVTTLYINFYSVAGDGDIMHSRHSPLPTWTAGHDPGRPAGVVPSMSPWKIKQLKGA